MTVGVLDAGIAIGWIQRRERSLKKIEALMNGARSGKNRLFISMVNLAEVLIHTTERSRATGVDPVALLLAFGVTLHQPDESVARRVSALPTSLADGFAAATALELKARLHTTDSELVAQLKPLRLPVTLY